MKHRLYTIFLLFGLTYSHLTAQLYPVDAFLSTQMNFPANVSALGSEFGGLNLTLILRDATIGSTEVRLRFYLENNGVRLVTTNDAAFAPISLLSNTPVVLTGADLQPYFLPQSFALIEGLEEQSFLQSGGDLPEGLYTICVEVLDFRRFDEAPLSDRMCSLTSMDLLDAPLITTPYDGQVIEVLDSLVPQPVDINWLMNYSTMVFPVDYQLYIYTYDASAVAFGLGSDFFNRQPLFETYFPASTLTLNNYIFGVHGEVEFLTAGQQYVLRVQARSPDQTVYFRNQGFSDPVVFQYGRQAEISSSGCTAPVIINATALSDGQYQLSWTEVPDAYGYAVVLQQNGELYDTVFTGETEITLSGLDPEQRYEGVVWVSCGEGPALPSAPFYITTDHDLPTIVFNCGLPTQPLLHQNTTPIDGLTPGDTIIAGDFKVKLVQVSGGGGRFSGSGVVVWNFPLRNVLNPTEDPITVNIKFSNISVNTDYFMYDGYMEIQGVGVNLVPPDLADFLREFGELDFIADDYQQGPELLEVDFVLEQVTVSVGSITIQGQGPDGPVSITVPWDGVDLEIIDQAGKVYVVDEDGNWSEAGELAEGGRPTNNNTNGVDANGNPDELVQAGVIFEAGCGRYAFDDVDPDASEAERVLYPASPIKDSESFYYSAYKAILKETEDVLAARIVGSGIDPDSLVFKTTSGRKIEHTVNGETITLQVKGLFSSATETILSCVKTGDRQELVGTFRLMHIPGQDVNVVLVPLGDASIPSGMDQALRDIYAPVAVDLQIIQSAQIPLPSELLGPDGAIDTEGTGTFANYTSEQQTINQYVRDQLGDRYSASTYYLLFTGVPSSTQLAGYMPLSRQYGYLFSDGTDEAKSTLATTAAHELGHGIFRLEHPFTRFSIPQGTTDWLMDYSQGMALPHVHWAQIYDPEFRLYLFQGDEEGESVSSDLPCVMPVDGYVLSPLGAAMYFRKGNRMEFFQVEGNVLSPTGSLRRFIAGDQQYSAVYVSEAQPSPFLGYRTGFEGET